MNATRAETRENTPRAIDDCHALIAWMLPQLDKFPRARRFTLGSRIEDGLLFVPQPMEGVTDINHAEFGTWNRCANTGGACSREPRTF